MTTFRAISFRNMVLALLLVGLLFIGSAASFAQATTYSGDIQGSITDSSGAVVANAHITITNSATGQHVTRLTSSQGTYSSGSLAPGDYIVRVENKGFQTAALSIKVQVGVTANGNIQLSVGRESLVVEVAGDAVQVNTVQPTVQGVLTTQDIENLPVSGRNFLDLAQLEPGVQIQDGGNFDPTKNGFSSVSFGGRAGRTARVTVDGVDISDESVGTVTQNVSAGTIAEFQLSQSTLDLSTDLTSSGAVNVVTKSGTNAVHGDGFYNFRDKNAGIANFPGGQDNYFQRNQFGGGVGGALVKDKLFWFANTERVKQATQVPISVFAPFTGIPTGYSSPFKDTTLFGKLDYNGPKGMKLFYRFNYNWNSDIAAYGSTYQPFANRNNTPSHAAGWDYANGNFSHSIRFGEQKFQNHIADAVLGSGVYDPAGNVPVAIRVGGASSQYRFGPSRLAPQITFQKNTQTKYDGAYLKGAHAIRYGVEFNFIRTGGLTSFYQWPELRSSSFGADAQKVAAAGPFPGGASNPLNYPLTALVLGNGAGYASESAAFGYPGGGQRDNRFGLYLGDTWKVKPNLTLSYGLRYSRDTGRSDSDLPELTCDQIPASTLAQLSSAPCTGKTRLLEQFGGNYGGRVRQPNLNFGPQVGFAWDPKNSGRTVIRGGAGLYYENAIFNNVLFDRPVRLTKGLFNFTTAVPISGSGSLVLPSGTVTTFPYNGTDVAINNLYKQPIGSVLNEVAALSNYYQQQTASGGPQANAAFIGAGLTTGNSPSLLAPNYQTPRSIQMNFGIQREIARNTVVSADFLRNVSLRYLLGVDTNHVGDVRYFNRTAAQNAIAATLSQYGATTIDEAIASGATMEDFAGNGLGSGVDIGGGSPASLAGSAAYAFGGINPKVGQNYMMFSNGRSVYTALQVKLVNKGIIDPLPGIARLSSQVSYSLSRFNTMTDDQDFVSTAEDQANPGRYFGPNSLDRTHQFSFGATLNTKHGVQFSFVGHVFSPLAVTPRLVANGNAGEIFYTDLTGDGTTSDIVPGANLGSFGRKYSGSNINSLIDNLNKNYVGTLTPAGQVLVDNGLFSKAQLVALGATFNNGASIATAPADQASLGWLRTFDVKLSYPIKLKDRVTLTPSVSAFNVFNFVNYDSSTASGSTLVGNLDGSSGSINGTSDKSSAHPRAGLGTGVNTIGSPRQAEFSLRLTF